MAKKRLGVTKTLGVNSTCNGAKPEIPPDCKECTRRRLKLPTGVISTPVKERYSGKK